MRIPWTVAIVLGSLAMGASARAEEHEAMHWAYHEGVEASPWQLCRELVAESEGASCRVRELAFERQGDFHGLWELRVVDGALAYSTLAVAGPAGVGKAHFWWRVRDPQDPGCPSITRSMGLERAWVEDGHLVLVSVGETQAYVEPSPHDPNDIGMRTKLARGVLVLSWSSGGLRTKDYTMWGGPTFGSKVAPTARRPASWDAVPWQARSRPKVVGGRLMIEG